MRKVASPRGWGTTDCPTKGADLVSLLRMRKVPGVGHETDYNDDFYQTPGYGETTNKYYIEHSHQACMVHACVRTQIRPTSKRKLTEL